MSKKFISYPFNNAFEVFCQSRSIDKKKTLFKSWLEGYVKFNMSIHISWLLKQKQQDVPVNVRVQLVQLFQKPPSIGFCFALSKSVNKVVFEESSKDSVWYAFARFFDSNLQKISRLIELRNAEAHAISSIDKDEFIEIR
jgi:hypothetical protein